jgi:hypothetical protein
VRVAGTTGVATRVDPTVTLAAPPIGELQCICVSVCTSLSLSACVCVCVCVSLLCLPCLRLSVCARSASIVKRLGACRAAVLTC